QTHTRWNSGVARAESVPYLQDCRVAPRMSSGLRCLRTRLGRSMCQMARVVDVHERPPIKHAAPLGIQHLFAMFGATVLVPFLTGLDPSVALLTSSLGTLLFILITKGQVPAYLGSSFAFIAPMTLIAGQYGIEYALGGGVVVGLVY